MRPGSQPAGDRRLARWSRHFASSRFSPRRASWRARRLARRFSIRSIDSISPGSAISRRSSEAVSISDREAAEQILRTLDHAELEELGDLFQESSDAAVANIIEAFRSCGSSKSDEVPLLRKALYHKSDSTRRRTFLVDLRPGEIIRVHEGNGEYLDDPGKFQRRGEKPIQIDGEVYLFLRKFGKWSPEPTLQSPACRNGTSRDV